MLTIADKPVPGRRRRLDPKPHFKAERANQLDAVYGSLELQLEKEHLVRKVWALVKRLDVTALVAMHSSLGRHAVHPHRKLAVLIYASLIGLHESTKVAARLKTDAALRWIAGGNFISGRSLRRFRSEHEDFFRSALEQSVGMAVQWGLIDAASLATDSVRIRAHASTAQVRTVARSTERLAELDAVDTSSMSEEERSRHEEKVRKHRDAIAVCEKEGRTNVVLTSRSAGLMKFPSNASAPGHRVTVTAAGAKERIAVGVLIDGSSTDGGKLKAAVEDARRVLATAGLPPESLMRLCADAGYWTREDLRYASENRESVDILITPGGAEKKKGKHFGRSHFTILPSGVECPAGKPMKGPYKDKHRQRWEGDGCTNCHLKKRCTDGAKRNLTIDEDYDRLAAAMHQRMAADEGAPVYAKRMAIIEPVFELDPISWTAGVMRPGTLVSQAIRIQRG